MDVHSRDYRARARRIIEGTPEVREAVTAATRTFDDHRRSAFADLDGLALSRWAEGVKSHALTHLADYLEEAEARLVERGPKSTGPRRLRTSTESSSVLCANAAFRER